jgi:hypothetical protein
LRIGGVVALVATVVSCHWPAMGRVADPTIGAWSDASASEDLGATAARVASAPPTRVAPVATTRVAMAKLDTPRSPPPIAKPRVRTPTLDCTPREELGYRRGKSLALTTIRIDGDLVETSTANAYWAMHAAAAEDGVQLKIYSGFRTAAEQEWFYRCYECGCCNGGVLAAKPGWSNHQSGRALDVKTSTPGVLAWLKANAARFGFKNTVRSEPWHWEYGGTPRFDPVCDADASSGSRRARAGI